jgi:hypothetical protein
MVDGEKRLLGASLRGVFLSQRLHLGRFCLRPLLRYSVLSGRVLSERAHQDLLHALITYATEQEFGPRRSLCLLRSVTSVPRVHGPEIEMNSVGLLVALSSVICTVSVYNFSLAKTVGIIRASRLPLR